MKLTGKLDYLEMPATGGTLDSVKAFYSAAFSWSFTDYGPTYSAFAEGLDGGFQADAGEAPAKPLPVLYSQDLEETLAAVENAGGTIIKPIFSFPGGRRFHFIDPAGNEMAVGASRRRSSPRLWTAKSGGRPHPSLPLCFLAALLITRRTSDSDGYWGVAKW
ncbi:glyoxalase [Mesorhizobium amorphae CCBAU 01583]|nr:glyoxalase [Mesorhizobium amorphae CCBAU 01583]